MQGKPSADKGHVHDSISGRKPLKKQHFMTLQDAELRVLSNGRVDLLQIGHGYFTHSKSPWCSAGNLPQPNADTVRLVTLSFEQAELFKFGNQPVSGGQRETAALRQLGNGQKGRVHIEGTQNLNDTAQS